jgi:geranylgeranyl diphosphate synthase type I
MLLKIKKRIDRELRGYLRWADRFYGLRRISPLLYESIREFACRDGKRLRPALFILSYLGYAKRAAYGLFRSAISLELLHDFLLAHDDIIDKSPLRRGKPSLHCLLDKKTRATAGIKFSGADLAIVAADVMYAMSMRAFLAIQEKPPRKEAALKKFIDAALYTGSGEFIELVYGMKSIKQLSRAQIFRVYDLKTARYTFASPLCIGAALAGAGKTQERLLFQYGIWLGRAFQIKDDILGIFGREKQTGKSALTDLREGKKTILIWQAWRRSGKKQKREITALLRKKSTGGAQLLRIRAIVEESGALRQAKREVAKCLSAAKAILPQLRMNPLYKTALAEFAKETLRV